MKIFKKKNKIRNKFRIIPLKKRILKKMILFDKISSKLIKGEGKNNGLHLGNKYKIQIIGVFLLIIFIKKPKILIFYQNLKMSLLKKKEL